MSPLAARILAGLEDTRLLNHIDILERFERRSPGEEDTLAIAYRRLEQLTEPGALPLLRKADPRLGLR